MCEAATVVQGRLRALVSDLYYGCGVLQVRVQLAALGWTARHMYGRIGRTVT